MSWLEGTRIGLRYYSPMEQSPVIFTNSITADDPNLLPDQWNNVVIPSINDDPVNGIPDDCLGVFLSGIAIISGGSYSGDPTYDLHIHFRRWLSGNNLYEPMYSVQAMAVTANGARHPYTALVPVDARRFQVYWTRSTTPDWPTHASYGFNAYVVGYVRP